MPALFAILSALLLGAVSYGLSIWLFILAIREMGSARTSALFGMAPFIGAVLSLFLFREMPQLLFWFAVPIMVMGTWLLLTEDHGHQHSHQPSDHHDHEHLQEIPLVNGSHSHPHKYEHDVHGHEHTPDLHHRHEHLA